MKEKITIKSLLDYLIEVTNEMQGSEDYPVSLKLSFPNDEFVIFYVDEISIAEHKNDISKSRLVIEMPPIREIVSCCEDILEMTDIMEDPHAGCTH